MLDLGTMFGAITVCYSGYYLNKRSTLIVPFLWIGTILMVFINFLKGLHDPVFLYCLLSFMTGFFIGGCFNNIATAIAVELSNDKELFSKFLFLLKFRISGSYFNNHFNFIRVCNSISSIKYDYRTIC